MRQAIRLTPSVTLRLTPRPQGATPRSAGNLRIKPKAPQRREALTGITNTVAQQESRVVDSTPKRKGNFITLPAADVPSTGIATTPEHKSIEESVPGPFLQTRIIREEPFSTVVAVRDMNGGRALRRGRPMCVKIMRRKEERVMIARELLAYKALSAAAGDDWVHYVMRLEASLEEAYHLYFVMELMDCDLMDVMTTWDLDLRKIHRKQWVAQIATGLAAVHAAGVIHRDLKPENILVDFRLNVRISDFGCSFVTADGKAVHPYGEYSDEIVGTWPYLAPELLSNRSKNVREKKKYSLYIDYWALGLIIFELEQDIDCPKPLFETEADLWAYVRYRPVQHGGRSYFAWKEFRFSETVESLLLGLIRPMQYLRFGDRELRRDRYFQGPEGYNEFDNIEERGRALNDLPVGVDIPSDRLNPDGVRAIYSPIAYGPGDHPGVIYSWINPQGIWGANKNRE